MEKLIQEIEQLNDNAFDFEYTDKEAIKYILEYLETEHDLPEEVLFSLVKDCVEDGEITSDSLKENFIYFLDLKKYEFTELATQFCDEYYCNLESFSTNETKLNEFIKINS